MSGLLDYGDDDGPQGGLLGFLNNFPRATLGDSADAPAVNPALAQMAGPAGMAVAQANYRRNANAALQEAAMRGMSIGGAQALANQNAGGQYSAEVMQAAKDAQMLRMMRMMGQAGGNPGDPFTQLNQGPMMAMMGNPQAGQQMIDAAGKQITPAMVALRNARGAYAAKDFDAASSYYIQYLKETGRLNLSDRTGALTLLGGTTPEDLKYISVDPKSGAVTTAAGQRPMPGAATTQAGIAGAVKGAEAANTPAAIPTQGGGSIYAYPGNVLGAPPGLGGGRAPQGAGAAAGATATAAAQPQTGAAQAWATMPKLPIPRGTGAPNDFVRGKLQKAGEYDSTLAQKLGDESNLADQQLEYSREAMGALKGAEVGPLSEWLTHNRAALLEAGVPAGLIPGDGSVTPTMELNKALKNAALQGARSIYGPRMTQMEVRLQHEEMSPSASMTRDAILALQQQNNVRAAYAKQRAQDYQRFRQAGGDPMAFETWYSQKFSLPAFAKAAMMDPQAIRAEMKRRGLTQ